MSFDRSDYLMYTKANEGNKKLIYMLKNNDNNRK